MSIRDRIVALERVKASDLVSNPKNWRKHPKAQRSALDGLLAEVGFAGAVLARRVGKKLMVIDGHLRKDLVGDHEVPVLVTDLSEAEADKVLATYDPIAAMATRDDGLLAELLKGITTNNAALKKMFEGMGKIASGGIGDADKADPLPKKSKVKLGQIFQLGVHRLMCGDSTNPDHVLKLMNGERAEMMATDPPYLVDYDAGNHPSKGKKASANKDWDAYKDPTIGLAFFDALLRVALEHALVDAPAIYQWHASRRQALVEQAWVANDLLLHQQIIWAKDRAVLTYCHFMWQHEPCFYGWKNGHKPKLKPSNKLTTVWNISQVGQNDGIHPTQKPVEIFAIPIRSHTIPGDLVYEPFSGSGTQIIAAEQLERRCFAMELAPEFVEAEVNRWEKFTGKKANLLG